MRIEEAALLAKADQVIAYDKQMLARMVAEYRRWRDAGKDPAHAIGSQTLASLKALSHHEVSLLLAVAVAMLAEQTPPEKVVSSDGTAR